MRHAAKSPPFHSGLYRSGPVSSNVRPRKALLHNHCCERHASNSAPLDHTHGTIDMLSLLKLFSLLVILGSYGIACAQASECMSARDGTTVCPKPDARCKLNRYGDVVCSTPGGGIEADRYGDLLCGPGYCVKDRRGDVFCSSAPRGAAAMDRYGNATCAEACVPANNGACVVPKPVK